MRKEIRAYRKSIDELLITQPRETDWNAAAAEHLVHISFFQHERLIHLLVTLSFALFEAAALILVYTAPGVLTCILALTVLLLLAPYIYHYFVLENEVQRMYVQYDAIAAKAGLARSRKGFGLAGLIIVIALIAAMSALYLKTVSSDEPAGETQNAEVKKLSTEGAAGNIAPIMNKLNELKKSSDKMQNQIESLSTGN